MSEITKFVQRRTKKRDSSDESKIGEHTKKISEGSLDFKQISQISDTPDDIFTESLNSPDYVAILINEGVNSPDYVAILINEGDISFV